MKMRTGLIDMDGTVPMIVKELTICFLALFNRQCISKAFIYLYHNGPTEVEEEEKEDKEEDEAEAFNEALIRALKYGVLSPSGIGAELKPYLQLAHAKDGLLVPEDYEENKFATRAVQEIFPQLHAVWQQSGEIGARAWVLQYAMEMFVSAEVVATEALFAGDVDEDEADHMIGESEEAESQEDQVSEDDAGQCECDFCEGMRAYDNIDLNTIQSSDPLDMLLIGSLGRALVNA